MHRQNNPTISKDFNILSKELSSIKPIIEDYHIVRFESILICNRITILGRLRR